ncbi:MacS family sensor histidine kinase [Streptacidiphilus sp. MAP5-3]|uniref:MacS family sensor histidine kinase n=1 Tax=unclassified Streptacidiphilus TaxID=2643834 RepID=UPI003511E8E1
MEQPLWTAIGAFRILTLLYAIGRYAEHEQHYTDQVGAWLYLLVLTVWTFGTVKVFSTKQRCGWPWLLTDGVLVVAGILLTRVFDGWAWVVGGDVTLPTIRAAGMVLGFAVYGGWIPAAVAGLVVGIANIIEANGPTSSNVHNIVLLMLSCVAIGFVVEVARKSEETLARALEIQAATRERERLARDIHDGVLQVLALVKRRGAEIGGEAGEIAALAGEQESALRLLIAQGLNNPMPAITASPSASAAATAASSGPLSASVPLQDRRRATPGAPGASSGDPDVPQDLRMLLAPLTSPRVTVAQPGTPVLLPEHAAGELGAAVGAALDNVTKHVGEQALAWILVEDEPDAVVVSVRDEGPGFEPARLGEAEREGRLGVSQSIRGRLRDLGGTAEIFSVPGQGTEVELRVPKRAPGQRNGSRQESKR